MNPFILTTNGGRVAWNTGFAALPIGLILSNANDARMTPQPHDARHLTPTILAAQQGDHSAFRQLVTEHKERVLRLAARFARDASDLDDLAQEIFISIHSSLPHFSGEAPLEHWIARIAARRCRDHLRRRYRWKFFSSLDSMQAGGFDPGVDIEVDNRLELLTMAMRRLKPDQQTCIILFEIEGYSINDIAAANGWTEAKVKVLLHRGRQALKAEIERLEPPSRPNPLP